MTADPQLSLLAREQRREWTLAQDLESLAAIARELVAKAPEISVEDVRAMAIARGLQFGSTDRGYLSRLFGRVMVHAGLEIVPGKFIRTPRMKGANGKDRGGNIVGLWRTPTNGRAA